MVSTGSTTRSDGSTGGSDGSTGGSDGSPGGSDGSTGGPAGSTGGSDPRFEYAPAPESRAVVDIRSSYGLFVDGKFVDGVGGRTFKTINPATEEVLAEV